MRMICLDIGTKRIGVAASDPLGMIAQPVKVIVRRGGTKDFEEIGDLCRELGVEIIVAGIPLDEAGGEGPAAARVRAWCGRLSDFLRAAGVDVPIEMWDERYSTATAEERLIGADVSRARRRRIRDKMAAVVILESYLEAHRELLRQGRSNGR